MYVFPPPSEERCSCGTKGSRFGCTIGDYSYPSISCTRLYKLPVSATLNRPHLNISPPPLPELGSNQPRNTRTTKPAGQTTTKTWQTPSGQTWRPQTPGSRPCVSVPPPLLQLLPNSPAPYPRRNHPAKPLPRPTSQSALTQQPPTVPRQRRTPPQAQRPSQHSHRSHSRRSNQQPRPRAGRQRAR